MSLTRNTRTLVLALALALVAAACTGGGDDVVLDDDASVSSDDAAEDGGSGGGADIDAGGAAGGLGGDAIPTDVSGPLVYSCAGRVIAGDSLAAALDGDAPSADDLSGAGFDLAVIGDADAWRLVADAGVIVGATPLATEPAGLVMVEPGGTPFACIATRAGSFDLRQVAFEPVDEGVAIESCVDPASVVVDRRDVDDVEVVSLFTDSFDAPPDSCVVDGSVTISSDDLGGAVDAETRTSFTWPFPIAEPAVWHRLGFVSSPSSLDGSGIDATALGTVECAANSLATEVFVEWSAVEPGFDVTVVAEGQDLFQVEFVSLDGSPTLTKAGQDYVAEAGGSIDQPVATGFVNGFSDYAAPVDPRAYSLRVDGGGADAVEVACGEAGISGQAPAQPGTTVPAAPIGGDLGRAEEVFENAAVSPFAYLRIVAICPGCPSGPIDLQMSPSSGGGVSHLFDPPLSQQAGSPATGAIVNPFEIHQVLQAAEDAGQDVSYTLDPLSGLPTQWTIDGVGGQILCFEVDTAPPDLRPGQVCETGRDLMSS